MAATCRPPGGLAARATGETGVTIVFTTHAPQHGLEVATEVLLMNGDGSYRHGPTAEVLTAGNLTRLYGVAVDKVEFVGSSVFTFAPRASSRHHDQTDRLPDLGQRLAQQGVQAPAASE